MTLSAAPHIDYRVLPLEYIFKTALGADRVESLRSVRILGVATLYERPEAGVFLMGMLLGARAEDRELRAEIVAALRHTRTPACAALLTEQLSALADTRENTLLMETLLDVLSEMPSELISRRMAELARDERFSRHRRRAFLDVIETAVALGT